MIGEGAFGDVRLGVVSNCIMGVVSSGAKCGFQLYNGCGFYLVKIKTLKSSGKKKIR